MPENWTNQSERGSYGWILLSARVYNLLGRRLTLLILSPAILFYYLNGRAPRQASMAYLRRAFEQGLLPKKPGFWQGYRHFMTFAGSLLDKLAGWTGKIGPEDIDGANDEAFTAAKYNGRGGLLLTAHMGNTELIRAVASVGRRFPVTVVMHTGNAEQFNAVIRKFSPDSQVRVVEVREINIGVAMEFSAAVERGEWVVITADRLPAGESREGTYLLADFLGTPARFPVGPYVLAAALKCPCYFLACIRTGAGKQFRIIFRPFADPVKFPRGNRQGAIRGYMKQYADLLVEVLREAPYQWFNFYDYWGDFEPVQRDMDRASADLMNREDASECQSS